MERKETENEGVRISYIKHGIGTPIILLHGNDEDSSIYSVITSRLSADGFCVYAMDSRGHGRSDNVDRLRYEDMAEDVIQLIRSEDLDKPVLFGFSDGGIVGLLLSIRYPGVLSRLIVAGINLSPDGLTLKAHTALRLVFAATRSDKLRLMLTQPDIKAEQLSAIDIPVIVFHAEKELVKLSDSKTVVENVKNGKLIILEGHTHDSYVMDNEILYELLKEHIS
jgi:pimeloyl-ACP methyl ester carboxylesterase